MPELTETEIRFLRNTGTDIQGRAGLPYSLADWIFEPYLVLRPARSEIVHNLAEVFRAHGWFVQVIQLPGDEELYTLAAKNTGRDLFGINI